MGQTGGQEENFITLKKHKGKVQRFDPPLFCIVTRTIVVVGTYRRSFALGVRTAFVCFVILSRYSYLRVP